MLASFSSFAEKLNTKALLVVGLMTVLIMMIAPIPAVVLDIGLALSFAIAILIFTVALFIERPLDFSIFPTLLLTSLVLRLALNVSSTKLIISEGHTGTSAAGNVIEGFAQFVMGSSVAIGLVIFAVLLIVNFFVVAKGATRMAEVSARFALDSMPGKQLAIDSDVAAGALSHEDAKRRRQYEQEEATFFGSLDGASKFVKGDAVAGLLITLLNLVVGLAMGLLVHGMALQTAFETYSILTVGDGLVTQIPAVIISVAAALLLARGGSTGSTDTALFDQLGRYPEATMTVAGLMFVFALIPGLPFLPFVSGAVILGVLSYLASARKRASDSLVSEDVPGPAEPAQRSIADVLDLDDVHIEFASDLVSMVMDPGTGLEARIDNMRRHLASTFGIILPDVRLTDEASLPLGTYVVRIHGVEQVRGVLHPDLVLALVTESASTLPDGSDVVEPVYGAPARWIHPRDEEQAALSGVTIVTPNEILATHLLEVIKNTLPRLLSMKSMRRLLSELTRVSDTQRAEENRKLVDELVPDKVPMDALHAVLRLLLDERVSIRNLPLILESVAEARAFTTRPESICEHVRQKLGFQLIAELRREDGTIPLIQLDPEWENNFSRYQIESDHGNLDVALPPDEFNRLAQSISNRVSDVVDQGVAAALVTSSRRRRFLRTVLSTTGLTNPVLSFEEIGLEARPALVGVVQA